jgi:hypothetical protein
VVLRAGGLLVAIDGPTRELVLEVARNLRRIPADARQRVATATRCVFGVIRRDASTRFGLIPGCEQNFSASR